MSAHLALIQVIQGLLNPNLRRDLPFVIMLLMIQGIHPEIIFNLIPYVTISRQQYDAIMMAWTQLRLFASLLPGYRDRKPDREPDSYLDQWCTFMRFPQYQISLIFGNFQNSVLKKMLGQFGFAGPLPSFEIVQSLVSNLGIVCRSHSGFFPLKEIFLYPDADLLLLKTALEMQKIIAHVRSSYPGIVSFLVQNENALKNIIMVWRNQVIFKETTLNGKLFDIREHEPTTIHTLFNFCILAVIDPLFIDGVLLQFIQNCRNQDILIQDFSNHLDFFEQNCKSFEPVNLQVGDIRMIIELFSSMCTSKTKSFCVRYALRPWSMAFGQIVHDSRNKFDELTIEQESSMPIFQVFSTFWDCFFQNVGRTFDQSFLPFGNLPWSEGYTRLIQVNFDWIIRITVENFAFRIGAKDDHSFLRSNIAWLSDIIHSGSYRTLIFPDNIGNCKMSGKICSCFLRDFWHAHQKPDPNMSDIDYIRWLFLIPGTFTTFGKSWIELLDALQNRTELPRVQDALPDYFGYLSCPTDPTDPTDPEVQKKYDDFRRQLDKDPEISDYLGGTAVQS
jgi:hypothetical protein